MKLTGQLTGCFDVPQACMVCANDEVAAPEICVKMLDVVDNRQEFSSSCAIMTLGI